jgi:hypothetical protein
VKRLEDDLKMNEREYSMLLTLESELLAILVSSADIIFTLDAHVI